LHKQTRALPGAAPGGLYVRIMVVDGTQLVKQKWQRTPNNHRKVDKNRQTAYDENRT
jgi:hypothetical protein